MESFKETFLETDFQKTKVTIFEILLDGKNLITEYELESFASMLTDEEIYDVIQRGAYLKKLNSTRYLVTRVMRNFDLANFDKLLLDLGFNNREIGSCEEKVIYKEMMRFVMHEDNYKLFKKLIKDFLFISTGLFCAPGVVFNLRDKNDNKWINYLIKLLSILPSIQTTDTSIYFVLVYLFSQYVYPSDNLRCVSIFLNHLTNYSNWILENILIVLDSTVTNFLSFNDIRKAPKIKCCR